MTDKYHQRAIDGARLYAAADRSDPFVFARALTHINFGLCNPTREGKDGFYCAEEGQEQRFLPDGRSYTATVYRNAVRL